MGLMDRIKKVTGTGDTYDEAYDDDYYQGFDGAYDDNAPDDDMQVAGGMGNTQQIGQQPMGNMGMNNAPMGGNIGLSGINIQMKVVYPVSYDSQTASQVANHLLNKSTVCLNLEKCNKETSRRLIDFLSGVAYSIGGSLRRIATNTYIVTPSNVDVNEDRIKPAAKQHAEPQSEQKDTANNDFSDFN